MTVTTTRVCPARCDHSASPHGFCRTHGEVGPSSNCCPADQPARTAPSYVYLASSWRNPMQPAIVQILRVAGIDCNPEGGTGFSWREVRPDYAGPPIGTDGARAKGSDWEDAGTYLSMLAHPRAVEGFAADFGAMQRADAFVLLLPCGKSAHLELGWAVGAGKRTAILLEDPVEPELMYRMVDYIAPSTSHLLNWLGIGSEDLT